MFLAGHTLSLPKLGTVRPGKAALKAQLSAHHIGQVKIHLVITHGAPCSIIEHLHTSFICIAPAYACETYKHLLGWQWRGAEEKQEEECRQGAETQHPGEKWRTRSEKGEMGMKLKLRDLRLRDVQQYRKQRRCMKRKSPMNKYVHYRTNQKDHAKSWN